MTSLFVIFSLLFLIVFLVSMNLYLTWWVYTTYKSDRHDHQNALSEIKTLAEIALGEHVVEEVARLDPKDQSLGSKFKRPIRGGQNTDGP